jgi:hypothetical protein
MWVLPIIRGALYFQKYNKKLGNLYESCVYSIVVYKRWLSCDLKRRGRKKSYQSSGRGKKWRSYIFEPERV